MNSLSKNGYIILKKVFHKKFISKVKQRLENLKPRAFIPFTNIPWGFGNLLDDIIFSEILKNKSINNQLKKFFKNKDYTFNHLMVNNKAPFFWSFSGVASRNL